MSEIPTDVMQAAREAVALECEINNKKSVGATVARLGGMDTKTPVRAAARAIMAERERCAGLVRAVKHMDEFDRVALLEAIRK